MPTGRPKTDAEKAADALMDALLKNARDLRKLVGEGAQAQAKLDRARAALDAQPGRHG